MNATQCFEWLGLISAQDNVRENLRIDIVGVPTGERTCYALRIGKRWLTSRTETLMFSSLSATKRFLEMVGCRGVVAHKQTEELCVNCWMKNPCYDLTEKGGLAPCASKKRGDRVLCAHCGGIEAENAAPRSAAFSREATRQ